MVVESVLRQALTELGLAGEFPEHSPEAIAAATRYVADATELVKFEGGRFSLSKKDTYYVLKKDDVLVGWVDVGSTVFNSTKYHTLNVIYILPRYRQTKATLLLVYGLKEILPNPIIVDGVLFVKGKELLNAVHARNRFKISTVNKKTGTKAPYQPSDLSEDPDKNFVIVEALNLGFYVSGGLPGDPTHRTYITLFEHLHDIE